MKILSVTYEYPPIGGGGSAVASAINEELVRMGDEVTVLTSAMKGLPTEEIVEGVHVHRTACVRRFRHFTTAAELLTTLLPAYRKGAELIRRQRPDVIHTHFVLPSGVVAWLLSKRFGIPYVLTAHGSDIPGYNPDRFMLLHRLLKPFWRRILRGATRVTSPSRFLAELIRRHAGDVPVDIVPNGHRSDPDRPLAQGKRLLVVSRLFPRKGVQHFIDAISGLDPDWEFVVAGDGPFRAHLEARARHVSPKVRFVGFVDRVTLRKLYESSSILVFPSIQENFPMVLLEGMDAGCAIVTTNAEGCAEVVGKAGLVVPKGDPKGIRDALDRLIGDPELLQHYAERGRRRAEKLAWPNIVSHYREVLQSGPFRKPVDFLATQPVPTMARPQSLH